MFGLPRWRSVILVGGIQRKNVAPPLPHIGIASFQSAFPVGAFKAKTHSLEGCMAKFILL